MGFSIVRYAKEKIAYLIKKISKALINNNNYQYKYNCENVYHTLEI